jgi:TRAP-type C4-dicarboxylate transport system substrate-binding protein
VDTMNALGGNGVAMGMDQLVNAMQTGVVDGAENNAPTYTTGQLTGHLMIPEILVFSKKTWNTLAQDDQALIARFAKEAQQDQRKLWYAMEEKSTKQIEAAGIEIIKIEDKAPFQAAVKPVWDKYGAQHAELIKRIQELK